MSSQRSQVLGPLDVGHKDKKEITGVGTAKLVQARPGWTGQRWGYGESRHGESPSVHRR